MKTVYLAGPIANTDADHAFIWREYAATSLAQFGIKALSPMRAKGALRGTAIGNNFHDYAHGGPFYTPKAIMTRDYNDVVTCDAILVNFLNAPGIGIGTPMEMAWAYMLHKPVVVVMEVEGNPFDNHPMLSEATKLRTSSLSEGIEAVAIMIGY